MWDLRTGQGIYELQITNSILCSSFHPNGYELALGGKNNMIDIFDIRRKKQIKTIPAHTKLISDLHYEQNGDVLVSGSHDNQIKIWHGRDYSSICDGLNHPSKITSVDIHENKITTTMIDSKWSMWIQQNT
jgi:U4/U6 small nuclear ribonucleoprotein PRP4